MPKFPPNTGFKMPGIGSKEINSPSNFRDDHHVDKMGYCEDTPDEMLPLGSSPLKYTAIIDDDPYTSVRGYDMSALGEAIAESTKRKKKKQPDPEPTPKEELNKIQNEGTGENKQEQGQIITDTKTTGKKTLRQAYDDALDLGFRDADESFEDYSKRAKADKDYGKGGKTTTTKTFVGPSGKKLTEEEYFKIFKK